MAPPARPGTVTPLSDNRDRPLRTTSFPCPGPGQPPLTARRTATDRQRHAETRHRDGQGHDVGDSRNDGDARTRDVDAPPTGRRWCSAGGITAVGWCGARRQQDQAGSHRGLRRCRRSRVDPARRTGARTGQGWAVSVEGRGTRATHEALPPAMRDVGGRLRRPPGPGAQPFRAHRPGVRHRSGLAARPRRPDGLRRPAELDLTVLRSWLAKQRTMGAARTSLARRAASARTFSAWAHRSGLLPADVAGPAVQPEGPPGAAHRAPRRPGRRPDRRAPRVRHRPAPRTERPRRPTPRTGPPHRPTPRTGPPQRPASWPGPAAPTGPPTGPFPRPRSSRAGGERRRTRTSRCCCGTGCCWSCSTAPGYGSARRAGWTSPTSTTAGGWCGCSARAAGSAPCRTGCRRSGRSTRGCAGAGLPWPARAPADALLLGARGGRLTRPPPAGSSPGTPSRPACPDQPARAAPLGRHPPAGGRRGPARGAGAARALVAGQHPDLHARLGRTAAGRVPAGAPARLTDPAARAVAGLRRHRAGPWERAIRRLMIDGGLRSADDGPAAARADPRSPAALLARPGGQPPQPRLVRRGADRGAAGPAAAARRDGGQPAALLHARAWSTGSRTPAGTWPGSSAPTRRAPRWWATPPPGVAVVLQSLGLRPGDEVLDHRPRLRRGQLLGRAGVPAHRGGRTGPCPCR